MKTFITIVTALATFTLSVFAAGNASTSSHSGASTATVNTCGSSPDVCPSCDGQNITETSTTKYTVYCDSVITSTDRYAVTNENATQTPRLCMTACDEFSGCLGAYYSAGSCILAAGSFLDIVADSGYTAFRRFAVPSAKSTPVSSTSVHRTSTSHASTTAVSPSATASSNTTSGCQATSISCPECDGEVVTDGRGQTYKVYCDNQLFADSMYSVQSWTSPSGCLLECDDYTWCKGSTFYPQGNCELAKGENVFPQQMPGYTAFSPVATGVAKAPPASPSMYPTGAFTSAKKSSSSWANTFQTVTSSGSTATPSPAACSTAAARCPECDGVSVNDANYHRNYTILCSAELISGTNIIDAGDAPQADCRSFCDVENCSVALWDDGHCILHTGSSAVTKPFEGHPEYVLFLWDRANVTITGTATTTATAVVSTTSQRSISTSMSIRSSIHLTTSRSSSFSTSKHTISSTGVIMTATLSSLSPESSVGSTSTTTSSASFVPPLTDGSVSYATPGGQTRAAVA